MPNGAFNVPLARSDPCGAANRLHGVAIASGSPMPAAGSSDGTPAGGVGVPIGGSDTPGPEGRVVPAMNGTMASTRASSAAADT